MAITGAIKLAYNRCQHFHKQPGIQKGTSCTPTKSTRHYTEVFQVEQTHQSHCILQIQQQLQTFQGQQANLSTQDLDEALTCCVKMVQQISYAQEIEELME